MQRLNKQCTRRDPRPAPKGGQGQNRNLASRLLQLDDQATRQQEVLYEVEFALQVKSRLVERMMMMSGAAPDMPLSCNPKNYPTDPTEPTEPTDAPPPPPQDMERKLSRAQGHRTEDETRALRERIEQLAAVLEGVNKEHGMLVEQVGLWVTHGVFRLTN
jgi:hypothetical protein